MTEMSMKITVFKRKGPKETVVREGLTDIAEAIRNGKHIDEVHHLRQYYHLMHPRRTEDGRMGRDRQIQKRIPHPQL